MTQAARTGSPVPETFRHALARIRGFRADQRGMAAVEFSLILPILLVLWIGGVEVTSALSVDRKLNGLASAIGDLTARADQSITYDEINNIFDVSTGAMFPYTGTVAMRVTAVKMDGAGNASVAWTRSRGTVPAMGTLNTLIPATLRVPSSQLIMAESYTTYRPAVGYVIKNNIDLSERMYFVPRLTTAIKLCTSSTDTACVS